MKTFLRKLATSLGTILFIWMLILSGHNALSTANGANMAPAAINASATSTN